MSDKKTKTRGSNFAKEDELLLIEEVFKVKEVVECKSTNKISNAEKDQAWKTVRDNFNAKSGLFRSSEQLKTKFDNLKTKARKVVSQRRAYIKGTGGGPSRDDGIDAAIEAILKIINIKTIVGLPTAFDCDDSMINEEQHNPVCILEETAPEHMFIAEPYSEPMTVDIVNFDGENLYTVSGGNAAKQSPLIGTESDESTPSSSGSQSGVPVLKGKANHNWTSCAVINAAKQSPLIGTESDESTPSSSGSQSGVPVLKGKANHNWTSCAVINAAKQSPLIGTESDESTPSSSGSQSGVPVLKGKANHNWTSCAVINAAKQSPLIGTESDESKQSSSGSQSGVPLLKGKANHNWTSCAVINAAKQSPLIGTESDESKQSSSGSQSGVPLLKGKANHNWTSYVPKNLKQPLAKKLKPTVMNPVILAKQKYYVAKELLLQEEIKASKARTAREEAEHQLKMKLLQLEIQIKEKLNKVN